MASSEIVDSRGFGTVTRPRHIGQRPVFTGQRILDLQLVAVFHTGIVSTSERSFTRTKAIFRRNTLQTGGLSRFLCQQKWDCPRCRTLTQAHEKILALRRSTTRWAMNENEMNRMSPLVYSIFVSLNSHQGLSPFSRSPFARPNMPVGQLMTTGDVAMRKMRNPCGIRCRRKPSKTLEILASANSCRVLYFGHNRFPDPRATICRGT